MKQLCEKMRAAHFLGLERTMPHLESGLTQFQAGIWVQLPDLIFPDKQIIYFMGKPHEL